MSNHDLKAVEEVFLRLLAGEKAEAHAKDLSEIFEFIAARLFRAFSRQDGRYFDGVVGLLTAVRSPRKIEFQGEMWIGLNRDQWTEAFRATLTDQRTAKQGFWIVMQIGMDRAEGEITSLFAPSGESELGVKSAVG